MAPEDPTKPLPPLEVQRDAICMRINELLKIAKSRGDTQNQTLLETQLRFAEKTTDSLLLDTVHKILDSIETHLSRP